MKRPLLLFAILLSLFPLLKPEKASAQITGVSVYVSDSFYTMCTLPNYTNIILYGSATGAVSSTDSVDMYVNTGDGFDTTFRTAVYPSSPSGGYFNVYLSHEYTIPGAFSPYVTATATGGATTSTSGSPFVFSDDCATLSGKLYIDANSNCTYDAGEVELAYVPIMVVNTTLADTSMGWWSNDSGNYYLNLAPGYSYNIIPNSSIHDYYWWWGPTDSNLTPTCPASGSYTIAPTGGSSSTENFAFSCTPLDSFDAMAEAWSWGYVPGDTGALEVWAGEWWWFYDYSCTDLTATVTLTLDPALTYVGVVPGNPAPTVSGSTLTWTGVTVSNLFDFYSAILVSTSTSAALGDEVCNTLYISPTSLPDPNLANNTYNWCQPVTSSFDPNGIEVSPVGTGTPGYIAANLPMSYNIHFQNTGTATATNITVVDTISSNLDVSTLHILKSSSPVEVSNVGNTVKFRFSNINLPDSISSPLGSIGTVSYGILQKQNLAPGTQIKSAASIYFDYNAPVKTNSTLNTIQVITGVKNVSNPFKASVYPNPANEEVTVQSADKTDFSVSMMDMLGRTMAANKSTQGSVAINTQTMPAGMYLIKITDNKGNEVSTKVNVQH